MELLAFERKETWDFLELKILCETNHIKNFLKNEFISLWIQNYEEREESFVIPSFIHFNNKRVHFWHYVKNRVEENFINKKYKLKPFPTKIDYHYARWRANAFVEHLVNIKNNLRDILTTYETMQVFEDEFARSIDLLSSLDENEQYFVRKVDQVASFLPKNQPLYALCCFVIVPSLMSHKMIAKKPAAMHAFFDVMIQTLQIEKFFPNIELSNLWRNEFIAKIAGEHEDDGWDIQPLTDAIIFTGTMENADSLRIHFSEKTLFISNGAGHNPLVVTETGNIPDAIAATMSVQLYNQWQDCAAPSSILVHEDIYEQYVTLLKKEIKKLKVGKYNESDIWPITEPKDLLRIQKIFIENIEYISEDTPGKILSNKSLVYPTIIEKPLVEWWNYIEQFAPIFFIQRYKKDSELSTFFETNRYRDNAMYVTVFGRSEYIESIIWKNFQSIWLLHERDTFLQDIHLHSQWVERWTQPYGWYGRWASNYSIFWKIISKPTLPQRDIYEQLICNSQDT